jgi:Putative prokaryotic signal transducing protein
MKEVSVHRDPTVVGFHKSILDEAGIDCFIRNENSAASLGAGALGLVQSPIFDPALCIADDSRYDEAVALLRSATAPDLENRAEWKCPKCGESVPGNFSICWNCASTNPEVK